MKKKLFVEWPQLHRDCQTHFVFLNLGNILWVHCMGRIPIWSFGKYSCFIPGFAWNLHFTRLLHCNSQQATDGWKLFCYFLWTLCSVYIVQCTHCTGYTLYSVHIVQFTHYSLYTFYVVYILHCTRHTVYTLYNDKTLHCTH